MTYKETLFFVSQCLTINHEEKNKLVIEAVLKAGTVDWEAIVKFSTAHYVFPALYLNLKRADFLHYLHEDLIEYMAHITNLNRERNEQIVIQAKEINVLLQSHGIVPIFLKGTGNLLEGLYTDIGERMVGDIDFIVSENEFEKTIKLVKKLSYDTIIEELEPNHRHYPRLISKYRIACIEIHKELLRKEFSSIFNYNIIIDKLQIINEINLLDYEHQLYLIVFSNQINDYGWQYKSIQLRTLYDIFLISKKCSLDNLHQFDDKIKDLISIYITVINLILNEIMYLKVKHKKEHDTYIKEFLFLLQNDKIRQKHFKITKNKIILKERIHLLFQSLFSLNYRRWFLKRLKNKLKRSKIF
jgi:hypothetical protein